MTGFLASLPPHARTVALLLVSLLVIALTTVLILLGNWYWQQNSVVSELEPRIARLLGYRESEAVLRDASEAAEAQLQGLVFVDIDAATVGATVQQQIRRLLEGAGMEVLGSQVVGSVEQDALEEIRINVTASGLIEALDQFLDDVANARPVLLVDTLEMNPVRGRRDEVQQAVNVSLSLKAVRALQ